MTGTTSAETEIRAILAEHAAAHAARDVDRILAPYIEGAVRYDLAPPLQQSPGTFVGDTEGLRNWLATFDGPVQITYRDPVVVADSDVAFAYALTLMTATPAGTPEPFSFWFRATFGLQRINGTWRIVHEHQSTPFHMDGSFLAATDLQP